MQFVTALRKKDRGPSDRYERLLIYLNLTEVIFADYLYLYLEMETSMQMRHLHLQATKLTCQGPVTAFLQVLNQLDLLLPNSIRKYQN